MEIIGYCKGCENPIVEDNFIEREWGFNYCSNELEVTDWYISVSYTHLTLPTIYSV